MSGDNHALVLQGKLKSLFIPDHSWNNALKCVEMRWNFVRNSLIFQKVQRKNLT